MDALLEFHLLPIILGRRELTG